MRQRWREAIDSDCAGPFHQEQRWPNDQNTNTSFRIVLAKVGLDGNDRGLRDAGLHVIYTGLWQSPDAVVRVVADEDVD